MRKSILVFIIALISLISISCNNVQTNEKSENLNALNTNQQEIKVAKREQVYVKVSEGEEVNLDELLNGYSLLDDRDTYAIFCKFIGKYPTADYININYRSDGSIKSYAISSHGFNGDEFTEEELDIMFKNEDNIEEMYPEYNIELAYEIVADKNGVPIPIRTYYGHLKNEYKSPDYDGPYLERLIIVGYDVMNKEYLSVEDIHYFVEE